MKYENKNKTFAEDLVNTITKETKTMEVTKEVYKVKCVKCGKEITGITSKQCLGNFHQHFEAFHKED